MAQCGPAPPTRAHSGAGRAHRGSTASTPRRRPGLAQPRWWWRPRVRSALVLAVLASRCCSHGWWRTSRPTGCGSTSSARSRSSGRSSRPSGWPPASPGSATTTLLLANFWVVERTAPAATRLARGDPTSGRLRRIAVPAYLAVSAGCGVPGGAQRGTRELAGDRALAPPARLRGHGSALPQGRGLLRLLAPALPEGRPVAVPDARRGAGLLVRGTRGKRRDPHKAAAPLRHARRTRPPARARGPAPARDRLAALARPVRARAHAQQPDASGSRVHRGARPAPVAARAHRGVSSPVPPYLSTRPCAGRGLCPRSWSSWSRLPSS